MGLELSDLFPEKLKVSGSKPISKPFPAVDILHCLNAEIIFLMVCSGYLAKGHKLEQVDIDRLRLSTSRFRSALKVGGLC